MLVNVHHDKRTQKTNTERNARCVCPSVVRVVVQRHSMMGGRHGHIIFCSAEFKQGIEMAALR